MIIDSHIHLTAEDYQESFDEFIEEALAHGVKAFINIGAGTGSKSAEEAVKLSEKYDFIYASVGIHPLDAAKDYDFSAISDLVQHPKVVAIGETGLDFYYSKDTVKEQYQIFRKQVELAHQVNKPLVIHSRSAAPECLEVLEEMQAGKIRGVFHCFSEDAAFAEKLSEINFMVSFPGVLTFKNAHSVREAASAIPIKQIMLETDGPFLAPEPYRGKLCRPAYITHTAKCLALSREMSVVDCNRVIYDNTVEFYGLNLKT